MSKTAFNKYRMQRTNVGMFPEHILKFKSRKRSKKANMGKAQKRKAGQWTMDYGLWRFQLTSQCGCPNIFTEGTQVYWLKPMMERRLLSDQDCRLIKSTCPLSALQTVNHRTVPIPSYTE